MTNRYIFTDCEICATTPLPIEAEREFIERMRAAQQRCVLIPVSTPNIACTRRAKVAPKICSKNVKVIQANSLAGKANIGQKSKKKKHSRG